jgi:carboxymethylenebutenolidase
MSDRITAETISLQGANGDVIEAYLATPDEPSPRGGIVVLHHMPGYDRATKEITRRFAELGYTGICPNLHFREAPGARPDPLGPILRPAPGPCP